MGRPTPLRLPAGAGENHAGAKGVSMAYDGRMTDALLAVHSDPGISGGRPVFRGTRVPVQALFDYLEGGETLDQFLDQFPSVSRQQAIAALDLARDFVLARARSA